MKVGDIMEKNEGIFMELDDTVDIGKEPVIAKNENEQKFHDELIAKYKNKYHFN